MSLTSADDRTRPTEQDCDLDAFRALLDRTTDLAGHPHAASVTGNVPVSDFGRAMETVDREAVAKAVSPVLLRRRAEGAGEGWLERAVAASAEGYPLPTNLDSDRPVDGLAPPSQADLVRRAVREEWAPGRLRAELRAGGERRES
jgi:hypothetical protein